MAKIILDIETTGKDFEDLDTISKEYLLRYAETEEEKELIKESLAFYPLTGEIIALGLLNPDTEKGIIYFQAPGANLAKINEQGIDFIPGSEREILGNFWRLIKNYEQIITFNGRSFDCPYIMIRSAIHKIKPTKNLMPYRYDTKEHVDLFDVLSFHGAVRRKFNLHMWCKAFGIESPKENGITGYEVKNLFKEGKFIEIARYCLGDLRATRKLFFYWQEYIKI